MSCNWGQIISFWGDIINLWGHIISFWGHIISFWGRYPYWGQGSIGGKIIILWGDFELGARLLTYGGILLTFGGVIINNIPVPNLSNIHHQLLPTRLVMTCTKHVMTSRETGLSKYLRLHFVIRQLCPAGRFFYYRIEHKQLNDLT